jgi:unsaturated rhamnogalacturonyl hydrolase
MLPEVKEMGEKVSRRFLETPRLFYNDTIHYAETFTWLGALRFAGLTKDEALISILIGKFEPLFGEEKKLLPLKNHVDFNMFGCLPLEMYKMTGEERYLEMGLSYADTQWELPPDATDEQRRLMNLGYTWQTRLWMDDMYMITSIQSQAWKITGDQKYINHAAHEMVYYLNQLQLPNGLFYHAPGAPFYWGRANGWMAAGMAELLKNLPEDNSNYSRILKGYILMMESLKTFQGETGMWKQLIDDPACWSESSSTGMFCYAMMAGINNRWLSSADYAGTVERAWEGLRSCIDTKGDVKEVCVGTPIADNKEFYYLRPRIIGDYHGQAPVLWCVNECLESC